MITEKETENIIKKYSKKPKTIEEGISNIAGLIFDLGYIVGRMENDKGKEIKK